MHVTFLTQYYPPEMGAPQARISEFAKGLKRRGWDVEVITALPNYPGGKVFPDYRGRWFCREVRDGIPLRRTWIRPDGSGRMLSRLVAALSFALSASSACIAAGRRGGVLIAESPPLTVAPAGALVARILRSAYVVNVSDLWPLSLVEMGVIRDKPIIRAAEAIEALSYRASALITAQAPGIVENIRERFPNTNVKLLSNGVDTDAFSPKLRSDELRRSLGVEPGTVLVTYAGLHGLAQGLDSIVDAAHLLRESSNVKFLLVGDGPTKAALVARAEKLELGNVCFLPPRPRSDIAELLASSDIALITLARPLRGAIPSKIYEAMASGIPVVAATGGGAAKIIGDAGAGVAVEAGNSEEIASAIAGLAADPSKRLECGRAGRLSVEQHYDRRIWIDRLVSYLEAVVQ